MKNKHVAHELYHKKLYNKINCLYLGLRETGKALLITYVFFNIMFNFIQIFGLWEKPLAITAMNAELPLFKNGEHNSESAPTIDRVITPLKSYFALNQTLLISSLK